MTQQIQSQQLENQNEKETMLVVPEETSNDQIETNLVPQQQGIVKPLVSVEEAIKGWQEYLKLNEQLLDKTDYFYYVEYYDEYAKKYKTKGFSRKEEAEEFAQRVNKAVITPRKKKSAWRKLARFYGLSINLIEEKKEEENGIVTYTYKVEAVAPNGARMPGVASCSSNEVYNATDHNIKTTAYTRAVNRAISDLIGGGEVSAEEISGEVEVIQKTTTIKTEKNSKSKNYQYKGEITPKQIKLINKLLNQIGIAKEEAKEFITEFLGFKVDTLKNISNKQANELIQELLKIVNDEKDLDEIAVEEVGNSEEIEKEKTIKKVENDIEKLNQEEDPF